MVNRYNYDKMFVKAPFKNKRVFYGSLAISAIIIFGLGTINGSTTKNYPITYQMSSHVTRQQNHGKHQVSSSSTTPTTSTTTTTTSTTTKSSTTTSLSATTSSLPTSSTTSMNNTSTSAPSAPSTSFSSLYTNPNSQIAIDARSWASSNPSDASLMNRLAATPIAKWFGGWDTNVQTAANDYVSAATAAGKMPTLVAYNIPFRDCGGYSSGGASSPSAYASWITALANGIGQRPAIVILEPDALAGMSCLSSANQSSRLAMIANAVQTLRNLTHASIYIDAGNPNWEPASVMQSRLQSADIAQANGFSLNVSNYYSTAQNIAYGNQLSGLLGGKHYVIDTSRNGNGPPPNGEWCNPGGQAVGQYPTLQTGNPLVDAYLWVKPPGQSDGTCGPSVDGTNPPPAGDWWPQSALSLMNNAGW